MDFAVTVDHCVKMKGSKKLDKYLDLAREQKKLWKLKMIVIPVILGELGMVSKSLEKRLGELDTRGRI